METTMGVTTPQETQVNNPVTPTIPNISLDPMDFQKELAKIAQEKGVKIENGNVVPADQVGTQNVAENKPLITPNVVQGQELTAGPKAASQPPQPQAEAQPEIKVPEKFQTEKGKIDLEKVQKSTANAEEALKKYLEKEAELRKLMNNVNELKNSQPTVQPPQPQLNPSQIPALTPELINKALEDTKNPGKVLLDLLAIRDQAVYNQAKNDILAEVDPIRQRVEYQQRQVELQRIADKDPWVFSEDGIKELSQRRTQKPWLNAAPEPWLASYKDYLADREMQKSVPQVTTPNPTVLPAKAPATPVNAGGRTAVAPQQTLANLSRNPAALNAFLDSLPNEAARKAFWQANLPGAK